MTRPALTANFEQEVLQAAAKLADALTQAHPSITAEVRDGAVVRTLNVVSDLLSRSPDIRFVGVREGDWHETRPLLLMEGKRLPSMSVTVQPNNQVPARDGATRLAGDPA